MIIVNTMTDVMDSTIKESAPNWLPVMAGEELSPIISTDSTVGFDLSNQDVNGWLSLIRQELYSTPSVEDIFVSIEDSDVDIWVVIPKRDITVLHQIVEREWELLKILVSGERPALFIEFHIIYRCGRKIEELAPTKAIRLPK